MLTLASCDYPEQGFFELIAIDKGGRIVSRQPFMVEELVDDTDMTVGFNLLLLHHDGVHIVEIPMDNTEGFESRGWIIEASAEQNGVADLAMKLIHIRERLKFEGKTENCRKCHPG